MCAAGSYTTAVYICSGVAHYANLCMQRGGTLQAQREASLERSLKRERLPLYGCSLPFQRSWRCVSETRYRRRLPASRTEETPDADLRTGDGHAPPPPLQRPLAPHGRRDVLRPLHLSAVLREARHLHE